LCRHDPTHITRRSAEVVIEKLNQKVRGWVGYFYYGNCSRSMITLRYYLERRMCIFLKRKHKMSKYPSFGYLYERLGLYKIPLKAPWTQSAKASERR
jgi:hypothetical protein